MITPTADDLWQTELFLAVLPPAQAPDRIGARLAYQHLLFGRAVLVDGRTDPAGVALPAELPTAADVPSALAGGARLVVVVTDGGPARLPHPRVRVLDGGLSAWAAAGLPVARTLPADERVAA